MDLHILNGGIGKQIMFTSVLDKLDKKICVTTVWDKLFLNHPMIEGVYPDIGWGAYDMKKFYDNFENIIYIEPYFGNFCKNKQHLIEAFHEKLNLPCDELYHTITFSDKEERYYSKFLQELDDFVLVQFTGSDRDLNKDLNQIGGRNLELDTAQEVINILSRDMGMKIIDVNNGDAQFQNTFVPRIVPQYRDYLIMTKYCKSFISIDSCLNHMSAFKNTPKKGVCLWRDAEYGKLFEYNHNINLYSELPIKMKFKAKNIVDSLLESY